MSLPDTLTDALRDNRDWLREVVQEALLEVGAADVFHVEEHVLLGILSVDEAVAASVVEEINRAFCHCF